METFLGIDYPTWWFIVIGFLITGYAILDGFDFGAGAWHLFFDKKEERRVALNAIGPVWDKRGMAGNWWGFYLCWLPLNVRFAVLCYEYAFYAFFSFYHFPCSVY